MRGPSTNFPVRKAEQIKAQDSQWDSQADMATARMQQGDPSVLREQDAAQTHHIALICSLVQCPTQQ